MTIQTTELTMLGDGPQYTPPRSRTARRRWLSLTERWRGACCAGECERLRNLMVGWTLLLAGKKSSRWAADCVHPRLRNEIT